MSKQPISRVLFPDAVTRDRGDDHSSRPTVARELQRPTRRLRTGRSQAPPYLVLLLMGFAQRTMSPSDLVSSYLTFSPLPTIKMGGLVSVALSLGSPPVRVTDHHALWSSDFPPVFH